MRYEQLFGHGVFRPAYRDDLIVVLREETILQRSFHDLGLGVHIGIFRVNEFELHGAHLPVAAEELDDGTDTLILRDQDISHPARNKPSDISFDHRECARHQAAGAKLRTVTYLDLTKINSRHSMPPDQNPHQG